MSGEPPKIYLAGPGVFRPDAIAYGALLQRKCDAHGLKGLYPLDNKITAQTPAETAAAIFKANVAMIDKAHGIVADISPFRGPNMDPGTAWEIGYGFAKNLPIFAWSSDASTLLERTQRYYRIDTTVDPAGLQIENFGGVENLMIMHASLSIHANDDDAIVACAKHFFK
jgi:nucleoside 2-deoxyribosyltransferase